VGVHRQEKGT
jgi:hypothetical protein